MKLTIEQLTTLSAQDLLDLAKIWPQSTTALTLSNTTLLFAARFNARLLAAAKVELSADQAHIRDFLVREVTRRRGVGRYLLAEIQQQLPHIKHWSMADIAGNAALAALMSGAGFSLQQGVWRK